MCYLIKSSWQSCEVGALFSPLTYEDTMAW